MNHVEAAKTPEQIRRIEYALADGHGQVYADIWKIGINLALRISDLLGLRYEQVAGDTLELVEGKTKKRRVIRINAAAREVIDRRRREHPDHVYLFQGESNRGRALGKPLSRSVVSRAFKAVGERRSIGLRLNTHSMRKTRGWAMHDAGKPIELICMTLNHSSPAVTMRYLGITQEEVHALADEFCL